jgi:uncharacterized caspase-like protein
LLRHLATAAVSLVLLVSTLETARAEKRVALVIGNSAYANTAPLKNPSNDAVDIAETLRQLDFEVIDGTDLSKREMEKRIRTFADRLEGADVGLFFYAGHGLQVDGRNFLAPVDATLKSDTDLDFEAIQLDLVLKQLERNSRVSIVFLDACRDNPLARNLTVASRSMSVGRGLAQVDKAVGMMIAFATQPGNVALDGKGRNSPFTEALLRHIKSEGASINDVMIDVRKDVLETTKGKQIPWENSSLTGQFYFKPAKTAEGSAAEIAALRAEIAKLKANQSTLPATEQEQLASLEQKLEAETGEAQTAETQPSRVIAVEPAANAPSSNTEETKTANLAPAALTDTEPAAAASETPEPLEEIDHAALARDIQTKLKALKCYSGPIDGDWGRGTRAAMEAFNRVAEQDLNTAEAEPDTLDALSAWTGEACPTKTIVRRKQAPAPKAAQPTYKKPAYTKKKPAYTAPKQAGQHAPSDIETETLHRLMRPAR